MKYSILVLGASISISLFIRICCTLEANSLYVNGPTGSAVQLTDLERIGDHDFTMLFSGRADEVYEKVLKFVTSGSVADVRDLKREQKTNKIVDSWVHDVKSSGFKVLSDADWRARSAGRIASDIEQRLGKGYFDDQLCGYVEPPDLSVPECIGPGCDEEHDGETVPEGCEYDESVGYMKCNDRDVTDIPYPLPPELDILDLNQTRIEKLPKLAFRNVAIKSIRLFDNTIEFVHPYAFHDVASLVNLIIVNNLIEYLAYEIYVGLNQTVNLDLQNNRISFEIYKNCSLRPVDEILPVLPKLVIMTLSGNPLKLIPKQMFAGLRNSPLRMLYLEGCYLEEIHAQAFSFLPNLAILNLNRNPQLMPRLATGLEGITSLSSLYLSYNGLSRIPTEALSAFASHLETLELNGNYISSIIREEISCFPNLKHLYMDDSNILNIADDAFDDLPYLQTLSLRKSRLLQIPARLPPSLKTLHLMNSNANMIRSSLQGFQNLTKLEILELYGIQLEWISPETFQDLTSLEHLFLEGCNIKHIDDNAFQHLSKVKVLSLDSNPIQEITPEMFYGLDGVLRLNMRNCSLSFSSLIEDASLTNPDECLNSPFQYLTNMDTLDLTGNKISSIPQNLFSGLPTLRYIYVSNNPIQSWEKRLFPERTELVLNRSDPNTLVLELNIVHGELRSLTDAMIEDFKYMSTIDLSHNTFVCDWGACKLRDIINSSVTASNHLQTWVNSNMYECVDLSESNSKYKIMTVSDEVCEKVEQPTQSSGLEQSSSGVTLIISLTASLSLVTAVIIILGYRNRVHLRYFFFVVKLNVMQASPRKAKLSTTESIGYDYDVFVSYHQEDSKFIEEVFLPEIEMQESETDDKSTKPSEHINEARNHIYTIENDGWNNSQNLKRFKVCLHERDFEAGVAITENIVDCVDRSKKTIIFISKKYMESQWCSFEMNLAYHRLVEYRRKAFVLVLLEDIPSDMRTKVLNYLMASKTYLLWPGNDGSNWDKLNFWKRLRFALQSVD